MRLYYVLLPVIISFILQKIIEFEENEAANRPADKDVELYFETCKIIREQLAEIAELKSLGTPEVSIVIIGLEHYN